MEGLTAYMFEGLDLLVGPEPLIVGGMERGAVGAVSGLATAFPELVTEVVVVQVLRGSPADGVIAPGDVVLAVNDDPIIAAEELQEAARAGAQHQKTKASHCSTGSPPVFCVRVPRGSSC